MPKIGSVITLNALYGTTLTASKLLVSLAPPVFLIGIRMTTAGTLLLFSQIWIRRKFLAINKSLWPDILQVAIFNIYLPYTLRYWSLQYLTVSKTALFFNLTPLVTYVIAYLLGLEKQCPRKWLAIIISFAGFIPIILNNSPLEAAFCTTEIIPLPELAMFAAIVSLSYSWIVMQKIAKRSDETIMINGMSMLIAGFLALITSALVDNSIAISRPWEMLGWLAFVIVITNFICYNWQTILLKYFSTTVMALASLVAPLVATLTSAIFLGEPITWQFCFATLTLALGIWIFYRTENSFTSN